MSHRRRQLSPVNHPCGLLSQRLGYSLVEIVLGIVLLSIALTAIFRLFAFSTMENRRINELDELYSIAERSMEYLNNDQLQNGDVFVASADYHRLEGYTSDSETLNKFFVIYKATEIPIDNPEVGDLDEENKPTMEYKNFDVTIEVYYSRDSDRLGVIGADSKVTTAKSLNISIISLNSQLNKHV